MERGSRLVFVLVKFQKIQLEESLMYILRINQSARNVC